MTSVRFSLVSVLLTGLLVSGCSTPEPEFELIVEEPIRVLYDRALVSIAEGKYGQASRRFQEVELQHPYSVWAARAQLMSGYVLYLKRDYDGAILAFDRYVELNPSAERRSYAEYMAGLSYFEQIVDVGRDQFLTHQAAERFERLIEQFPDSEYARDARVKYDLTQDQLAGKHMEIGRFYQVRNMHTGAINRFRRVIKDYSTTSHVSEALFRLSESQLFLGLREDAQMAAAVLGYNYPNSAWYRKAYDLLVHNQLTPKAQSKSWLKDIFDMLNPLS